MRLLRKLNIYLHKKLAYPKEDKMSVYQETKNGYTRIVNTKKEKK